MASWTPRTGNEVRRMFLDYFAAQDHRVVSSYPLIPPGDPTLLFTNAGMVQFKDVFTGARQTDYRRATSSQKCLRVSGKHNDLENVGRTPRHHTFFEMLGNFSFGDYFKEGAIRFAWELMTQGYELPPERLLVTVYEDDDQAFDLWHRLVGVPTERILRFGDKDNFWAMGDTGPCGPCSEIHWDRGPEYGEDFDARYVELWNLVFMQYDRQPDGTLIPLPSPSIDTGAGLERITTVLQGHETNYDSDLFREIIARVERVSGKPYGANPSDDVSMRVIADHARATAFLVAEGVFPENEGTGYVLRRLMRRAIRHGTLLGLQDLFFHEACLAVVDCFGGHYGELKDGAPAIERVAQQEEQQFRNTLGRGLDLIKAWHEGPDGSATMPGDLAFRLYDTYGFPLDLTEIIGDERGFAVDTAGFDEAMEAQRRRGRASWKGAVGEDGGDYPAVAAAVGEVSFTGYEHESRSDEPVVALLSAGRALESANAPAELEVVTAATPFYAEAGGQVGDRGTLGAPGVSFEVQDTRRPVPGLVVHVGRLTEGTIAVGTPLEMQVDGSRRAAIRRNHTATHLLHHALRACLGSHVRQKGSLVAPERLRFDFAHFEALDSEQLQDVERVANQLALANDEASTAEMDFEEALRTGAMAFFEDKYGDSVRVVQVGPTAELCGGTHVSRSGDIGQIRVVAESGIAAGVRRIEAVTGLAALALGRQQDELLGRVAGMLRAAPTELADRLERLQRQVKALERDNTKLKGKLAASSLDELIAGASSVGDARIVAAEVPGVDDKGLMALGDRLREALGSGVLLLARRSDEGKVGLLCMVTSDLRGQLHAGKLIKEVARMVGGGGGGAPHMAKAGGRNPDGIPAALERLQQLASEALGG